jgi:hypothetical protein
VQRVERGEGRLDAVGVGERNRMVQRNHR